MLPTSYSNWPTTRPETISEQRSIGTLHKSTSLPRLNSRATRHLPIDEEPRNNALDSQRLSYWPSNWLSMNPPPHSALFLGRTMPSASHACHWMERHPFMKNIIRSLLHLRIVDKEVSAVISRETGGNGSRRSLHEVESGIQVQ
jgi:hypothetical protein